MVTVLRDWARSFRRWGVGDRLHYVLPLRLYSWAFVY